MAELEIGLHPLVILNIADHFTRSHAESSSVVLVMGALMGEQSGRHVDVNNTLEIVFKIDTSTQQVTIDEDQFKVALDLYKEVFPAHEILGWYSTKSEGPQTNQIDEQVRRWFVDHNESPLFLTMDPSTSANHKELPIRIFESDFHIVDNQPKTEFVAVDWQVATEDAERITVDHIVKTKVDQGTGSILSPQLRNVLKAVEMLHQRIALLFRFLDAHQSGKIQAPQTILREVKSICNRLPTMDHASFKTDFVDEYNDALLVTYLASLTKGTHQVNELIDRMTIAFDKGRGGQQGAWAY